MRAMNFREFKRALSLEQTTGKWGYYPFEEEKIMRGKVIIEIADDNSFIITACSANGGTSHRVSTCHGDKHKDLSDAVIDQLVLFQGVPIDDTLID